MIFAQARKRTAKGLVLYGAAYSYIANIADYVRSFGRHSKFDITYANAIRGARADFTFDEYDFIIVNYCCCLRDESHTSADMIERIRQFRGVKILAMQDEYDNTGLTCSRLTDLRFDAMLTCVPPQHITSVYPPERFPHTVFVPVLTGYVPEIEDPDRFVRPLRERTITVGYRGRDIGFGYGDLGYYKLEVGRQVRKVCERRGIPCDIDWTETSRIYNEDWYRFVASCRTTLGSESGSNVFDYDGSLRQIAHAWQANNPDLSYERFRPFIADQEALHRGEMTLPRLFEAAALWTPMILVEGNYLGVIQPEEHYIPLKRDFSNIDEVLDRLDDLPALEAMAQRAHRDLIASGRFSYRRFVAEIDDVIERKLDDPQRVSRRSDGHRIPPVSETDAPDHFLSEKTTPEPLHTEAWQQHREERLRRFAVELSKLDELPDDRPIFIYGTGFGGTLMLRDIKAHPRLTAVGFLDSTRSGEFLGLRAYSLREFLDAHAGDNPTIVIASSYVQEIAEALVDNGVTHFYDASRLIVSWIKKRKADLCRFSTVLENVHDLPIDRPIFIYGTGFGGTLMLRNIKAHPRLTAVGFLDSARSGEFLGLRTYSLREFLDAHAGNNPTIVIASSYVQEIAAALVDNGVTHFYDASRLIVSWIKKRKADLYRLTTVLENIHDLPTDRPILICGTERSSRALRQSASIHSELDIAGFVDNNRSGEMDGLKIYSLSEILYLREAIDPIFVIASIRVMEILDSLAASGVSHFYDASLLAGKLAMTFDAP